MKEDNEKDELEFDEDDDPDRATKPTRFQVSTKKQHDNKKEDEPCVKTTTKRPRLSASSFSSPSPTRSSGTEVSSHRRRRRQGDKKGFSPSPTSSPAATNRSSKQQKTTTEEKETKKKGKCSTLDAKTGPKPKASVRGKGSLQTKKSDKEETESLAKDELEFDEEDDNDTDNHTLSSTSVAPRRFRAGNRHRRQPVESSPSCSSLSSFRKHSQRSSQSDSILSQISEAPSQEERESGKNEKDCQEHSDLLKTQPDNKEQHSFSPKPSSPNKRRPKKTHDELDFVDDDEEENEEETKEGKDKDENSSSVEKDGTEALPTKKDNGNGAKSSLKQVAVAAASQSDHDSDSDSGFRVGRTRTSRLKAKLEQQKEKDSQPKSALASPERPMVRFNCRDDDIWTASADESSRHAATPPSQQHQYQQVPSSLSSYTTASSSVVYSNRRKRRRPRAVVRRKKNDSKDNDQEENQDDDDDDDDDNNAFPPPEPRVPSMIGGDHGTAGPRGVGVDAYDLQDDGQLQMLTDEIAFLCDGIRQKQRISTALELTWLVSMEKNRQILWKSVGSGSFQNILSLLAELPFSLQDWGDNNERDEEDEEEEDEDANDKSTDPVAQKQRLIAVMETLWHFISADCTWAASPSVLERARSLRLAILSHGGALAGLVQLIRLQQEVKSSSREEVKKEREIQQKQKALMTPPVSPARPRTGENQKTADTPDSQASLSSVASDVSTDPTVAGRKRKRKGPPITGMSSKLSSKNRSNVLPVISEGIPETSDAILENKTETATVRSSASNELSFASSVSAKKNRDALTQHAVQEEQWKTILKRTLKSMGEDKEKRHPPGATFSILLPGEKEGRAISHKDSCKTGTSALPLNLPLLALQRILTGRMEGEEKSCLDESDHRNNAHHDDDDDDDEEESRNPLIVTNRLLARQPRTISLLAMTMGQTVSQAAEQAVSTDENCIKCLETLTERINILASAIDGACLFHDGNRQSFCRASFGHENKETLVPNLVSFLQIMWESNKEDHAHLFCGATMSWISGVGLEVLKTLTSLTHDNRAAVKAVIQAGGLEILAQMLHSHSAAISLPHRHDDLAIFALNTMANLVESSLSSPESSSLCCRTFTHLKVKDEGDNDKSVLFLPWLTRHLVHLTESFQNELITPDDIDTPEPSNNDNDGSFIEQDRDNLLLAGNGFVLLAYLLVGKTKNTATNQSQNYHDNARALQDMVLEHLPGTFSTSKICFLQKILFAFCNFYRHSVGDLSVAIIAPVQSLLQVLADKVQKGVLGPSPAGK